MRLRRRARATYDPAAPVFARLRIRLTVLYCLLLGAALLTCGALLYVGLQRALFNPIHNDLTRRADRLGIEWQLRPAAGCLQPGFLTLAGRQQNLNLAGTLQSSVTQGLRTRLYSVCFDTRGRTLPLNARFIPLRLQQSDLALRALQNGTASDTVDAGEGVGNIERFAEAIPDASGPGVLGVVLVAVSVEGQLSALHALLKLLVVIGIGTLSVAGLGGLLLSGRAMGPARMALARQREFVAAAAHELRTPLTMLRADAELLLRSPDLRSSDDTALVRDMVSECAHMAALAETMLSLARLDAGQAHFEREVLSCQAILEQLARRVRPHAAAADVAVRLEAGPPTLVLADPVFLDQVLLILLDNAVKYNHPNGTVTLAVSHQHGNAVISVVDTGIGIDSADMPRLGERFFRADKARSRASGGAGLGLSIARLIAHQLGGVLEFESTPGRGTTARLLLPLLHAARDASDHDKTALARVTGT